MEYRAIGKVTTTHGIKGELKVYSLTDSLDRFFEVESIYLGESKLKVTVENAREHKGQVILKLEEYNNINDVLMYKDEYIYINDEESKELEDDEFFINDIIGIEVFDMKNNYIGKVESIMIGIGNDIYIIKNGKKEYLIPAVKEFIKDIDIEKQRMLIDPIEGMIS